VKTRLLTVLTVLVVQALLGTLVVALLPVKPWALSHAIPTDYFEAETAKGDAFEQVADRIYAFRHGIDRALIVDSGEGLAVFDTFSTDFAEALHAELSHRFPNEVVRWVFYSHNHLDHIRGAAVLKPAEIVGHEKLWSYVQDWPHDDVAQPTRTLAGDAVERIGSVEVRLVFLGHSHSDTLYAYYFPAQRVVYAPDTAFIRTMPPFGLPNWYYPGYMRALDRIAGLDFVQCVPSHFDRGSKADFLDYRQMLKDFRDVAAAEMNKRGQYPTSGQQVRDSFNAAYPQLKAKYGTWLGFDAMFVPHFVGSIGGNYLGY
jgi:glyoxylase-like metal-dependent hydrolase (beta-lactamase superfamily II)